MKIIFRGHLYEENFHYSKNGYFNETYQKQLDRLVGELLPQVISLLEKGISEHLYLLGVSTNKIVDNEGNEYELPKIYFDHDTNNTNDANVSYYEDGMILKFNEKFFKQRVNKEQLRILLAHEVNHILQAVFGTYIFKQHNSGKQQENVTSMAGLNDDEANYVFFNSPEEINSMINSLMVYIRASDRHREYMKSLSYEKFVKAAFQAMGYQQEEVMKYVDPHGEYLSNLRGDDNDEALNDSYAMNMYYEGIHNVYTRLHGTGI